MRSAHDSEQPSQPHAGSALRSRRPILIGLLSALLAGGLVMIAVLPASALDSPGSAMPWEADAVVVPQRETPPGTDGQLQVTDGLETAEVIRDEPTRVAQISETSPAPTVTQQGYGEAEGPVDRELLAVMVIASGVLLVGGALLVVLMMGRERRRRDRAAVQEDERR